MSIGRPGLAAFNTMERDEAHRLVRTWLDVPRWADDLAVTRPYADVDELETTMVSGSATITDVELEQALARHPRIGERADDAVHDAEHSTREQSGVDQTDAEVARRLEEGNRAYEQRFGRVFIIRAAGRDAHEIVEQLRLRLENTDELERAETIDQLTQIAVLRMKETLS
ncbi:2-oxo-4-hydroxy-4-carboxy-5-ureidoimidazoline decarboxylase [Nocardioides sp.]|uniref:2-oxo-4-hydroxy-4-carboxy-5-ureidoimidazoline decarboxylase n=1 Tax=Nocardioides sp. TaxID=35761 RepID=UPI002C272C2E|nr:2-oxo-4-hydroxy-4-carboxy-5-ureidoimidazoline decarboxylase [Nocardioides sp.]HXH76993.1 2-oxo-4-hydroxy-4-carboxy-5-ureidoimidazoline decarboxylase [Nocardioides sp.]